MSRGETISDTTDRIHPPAPSDTERVVTSRGSQPHGTVALSRRVLLRVAPVALILFIGAAFVAVTLTGTRGTVFEGLVLASSLLLVLIVCYLAFAGGQPRGGQTFIDEFDWIGPGESEADDPDPVVPMEAPRVSLASIPVPNPTDTPVRAFVESLVAVPPVPPLPATPATRRAYVAALRREGKQLLGLARVTGVNTEPYRLHLLDARMAAFQGELEVSLTSLRLANELLRRTVESAFLKHQNRGEGSRRRGGPDP